MVDRQPASQTLADPDAARPAAAVPGTQTPRKADRAEMPSLLSLPPMRYPNAYLWAVLFSTMDVMFTTLILYGFDGDEVNPIALLIIDYWGMAGATVFKFCLILFAIVICEIVDRVRPGYGRFLAVMIVAISAIPVVWSLYLMVTNIDLLAGPAV